MSRACGRTIGPKTLIRLCGGASASNNGSSRPDQPSVSSRCMHRFITPSMFNAIRLPSHSPPFSGRGDASVADCDRGLTKPDRPGLCDSAPVRVTKPHLGLNGTRAISLRLRPPAFREPWRFGGVQTPTLAILADLEKRIRDFVPQDYFKISLTVATDSGAEITLWHAPKDKILDKQVAETIQQAAAIWSGPLGVKQKDVRRSPPRLFSKDTLARRCAKRFGWDPQHTAKLAQELYDQGYLTYPRTESEHLPESQTGDASTVIESIVAVLTDLAGLGPAAGKLVFRKGNKGHYVKDPGEHHAIVPLRKVPQPGSINGDNLRLWELVAKSFLAAHLPDGIDARTTVAVQVPTPFGPKRFSISGSVIKSPG